jgi:hypothetical protein
MMKYFPTRQRVLLFAFATILFVSSSAFGAVTITVKNLDGPGVGFNDPTPVSPVGGNNGTTLGQQRLIAAQTAADIWGSVLTGNVPIVIGARWANDMPCEEDGATLASAGSHSADRNFPNAVPNTLYPLALAHTLSGSDRNGLTVEIDAEFNLRIGTSGCLSSVVWYYGLDNNHGNFGVDLVTVALHEFGHGLGFASFTNEATGVEPIGMPTIYDRFLRDNTTGKFWPDMTDAERQASAINFRNLVWMGSQVTGSVPGVLTFGTDGSNHARVFTPNPVQPGSSVSHFDTSLTPNQLMEPNINPNLTHSVQVPQDLTLAALVDMGWNGGIVPTPSPTPTPSPPPNDNFASAQTVSGCSGTVTGTNAGATEEPGEPHHIPTNPDGTPADGTHSVWYQWQAPTSASVTFTTAGSNYDTVLAVYTGTAVNNLVTIGQNDDVNPGIVQSSTLTFNAVAGTIYKIAVDGFNDGGGGDTGAIQLNWTVSNCFFIPQPQILLEQSGPALDQAAAFDSMLWTREPFPLVNSGNLLFPGADRNTRVVIFLANMAVVPSVVVNLVDSQNVSRDITSQDVRLMPDSNFVQVTFRLPDNLPSGTCRVKVVSGSLSSNTATFRISP